MYDENINKCTLQPTSTTIRAAFTTLAEAYVEPRFMANGVEQSLKHIPYGIQSYNMNGTSFGSPL
jgi:hypothetical protein